MKVFVLNVPSVLQPDKQAFNYPAHNKDYGIEQDFLIWIKKQKAIITHDAAEADWHYLPVYWTRWHINHNFAIDNLGLAELKEGVDKALIDDTKTFTISQFDGGTLIDIGKAVVFTSSYTDNQGIDIPILCSPHRKPPVAIKKKFLASFNGSFTTHPIREEMKHRFEADPGILIQGTLPTRFYKRWFWAKSYNINIMASYIALCPRGTTATSFRFFEAMQLGTAPCLVGKDDVRPFKKFIPWDEISYYAASVDELETMLKNLDKTEAIAKGKRARYYWKNELRYQKWCKYVIKELEQY